MAHTESSSGNVGLSMEKLDGSSNYSTCEFQMELLLIDAELWEYTSVTPEATDTQSMRRDQKARVRICMMVKSHCQVDVRKAKTTKDAWDALSCVRG